MKTVKSYLLPAQFKRIGLVMFVPFLAACVWLLFGGEIPCPEISVFAIASSGFLADTESFTLVKTNPVEEICMVGLLVSLCFMSLSREKDEDEMTGEIRMQSFVWSMWATAAIVASGIIFLYGIAFLQFAFSAIFLNLLSYFCKFNLEMRKLRRNAR